MNGLERVGGRMSGRQNRLFVLALLSILAAVGPGCRRAALVVTSRRYVRTDALLPLHPLWPQVAALDRAVLTLGAPRAGALEFAFPTQALPKPFTPPQVVPATLARSRQRRVEEDAQRYVAQLAEYLQARNEEALRREERAERKKTDAQFAQEVAAREEALRQEAARRAQEFDRRIRLLGFREIALRSQVKNYIDQPKADAQAQQQQVLAEISRLTAERDNLASDARPQAERELEARRRDLEAALKTRLAARQQELSRALNDRIAHEQARLANDSAPIPSLESMSLPPGPRNATPLLLPAPSPAQPVNPQAQLDAFVAKQRPVWAAQRARLVDAIRVDIMNAVAQVARRDGWQLVAQGTPGAADATEIVQEPLRKQWRQGVSP